MKHAAILLTIVIGLPALQDADRRLEKFLERLQADDLADRDAAQRELAEFLDDDAKAEWVRKAAGRVDVEVKGRLEKVLTALPSNKALRRLESGDDGGFDDLFAAGEEMVPRVRKILKAAAGKADLETLCTKTLGRLDWAWLPSPKKTRIGYRIQRSEGTSGDKIPIEVKVMNESDRDMKFGSSGDHQHTQFSPSAFLTTAKERHQIRINVDSAPLPSLHDGGCEVRLKGGVSAVLKGWITPILYTGGKPVAPETYRLDVDMDLEGTMLVENPNGLAFKVLEKK